MIVTDTDTEPETEVPPDATPHVCDRCGRPFADEQHLALHRGLAHAASLSEAERQAYESAHESEVEGLRRYRLLALAGVVAIYFGFLLTYAVVT